MVFTKRKHGIYEVNVIEAPCNMFLVSNKMEITERRNLMALRAEVSRNNIFFWLYRYCPWMRGMAAS